MKSDYAYCCVSEYFLTLNQSHTLQSPISLSHSLDRNMFFINWRVKTSDLLSTVTETVEKVWEIDYFGTWSETCAFFYTCKTCKSKTELPFQRGAGSQSKPSAPAWAVHGPNDPHEFTLTLCACLLRHKFPLSKHIHIPTAPRKHMNMRPCKCLPLTFHNTEE